MASATVEQGKAIDKKVREIIESGAATFWKFTESHTLTKLSDAIISIDSGGISYSYSEAYITKTEGDGTVINYKVSNCGAISYPQAARGPVDIAADRMLKTLYSSISRKLEDSTQYEIVLPSESTPGYSIAAGTYPVATIGSSNSSSSGSVNNTAAVNFRPPTIPTVNAGVEGSCTGSSCSVQGGSRKNRRKSRKYKSKKQSGRGRKSLRKTIRKTH